MPKTSRLSPPSGEDELIEWLRQHPVTAGLLGDDAALLLPRGEIAVTMDTQVSGIHFQPDRPPELIARRLLRVNLSDLAAMGAKPTQVFLALSVADDFDHLSFFTAFLEECEKNGCQLAGGDLSRNRNTTAVVTLFGELPTDGQWLRRQAARPGQDLWIGGTLGESALGLELLERGARIDAPDRSRLPETLELSATQGQAARRAIRRQALPHPQIELGQWLAIHFPHAAIDVSDGLAKDLHRLCRESGVGATVDLGSVPTSENFRPLCRSLGLQWRELVLAGGEDYVLLFTLPNGIEAPSEHAAQRIGKIHEGPEIQLQVDGRMGTLPALGWDHMSP